MQRVHKRLIVIGTLAVAMVLSSVTAGVATFGPGHVEGFVWTQYGEGVSQDTVQITAKEGKSIVTQRYSFEPGYKGLWPTHPGESVVIVNKGTLTTYENCGEKSSWEHDKSYYRNGAASPKGMLVQNDGADPVEILVTFFDVPAGDADGTVPWGDPGRVAAACATPAAFTHYEYGRGVAYTDIPFAQEKGTRIVMQSFVVAPGWHFNWHTHWPTFVVNQRGSMKEWIGCEKTVFWKPGTAYLHSPGTFGRPQERAKNVSDEPSEFFAWFSKVPSTHVKGMVPFEPKPPPDGCLSDGTVANTN